MLSMLVAFGGVALLASIVPGPDTAVVVKNAVRLGRPAAIRTAGGCSVGQLIWGAAALLGISAVLTASAAAFTVAKLVGAAYLLYLGITSIVSATRGGRTDEAGGGRVDEARETHRTPTVQHRHPFREGLLVNLLNPKTGLFMTALLPQFLTNDNPTLLGPLLIAITGAVSFCWMSLYAVVLDRFGRILRRPAVKRALDRVIGTVLVGLGIRLALQTR
jgi:threonine/homoserine/homoserine lactone efflux protein